MPSCDPIQYPIIKNPSLELYEASSRLIDFVRRPKATLVDTSHAVNIYDLSYVHEIDIAIAVSNNIELVIEHEVELDFEILHGITIDSIDVVLSVGDMYIQIDQNIRDLEASHETEIDLSFSIGTTLTIEVDSITEIDSYPSFNISVSMEFDSISSIDLAGLEVGIDIPLEIGSVAEIDLTVLISLGPTMSLTSTMEVDLDFQWNTAVTLDLSSVTEIDSDVQYSTTVDIELVNIQSFDSSAGVYTLGASSYMLANRSSIDGVMDTVVTLDTEIDNGMFKYFKLDHCVMSRDSLILLNSPFKAHVSSLLATMSIENWCPNLGIGDLRYYNFINFLLMYNVNEMNPIQQHGDTTEIVIPYVDNNHVAYTH